MEQDPEEQAHYASVLLSFREYEAFVMREIFRRKKHLQALPVDMQRRLPQSSTMRNLHHFVVRLLRVCVHDTRMYLPAHSCSLVLDVYEQNAARHNQTFLERIVQAQLESGPEVHLPALTPKSPLQSPMRHLSKLKSTLHQFVRDWSDEGKAEREMCYAPILKELKRVLPVTPENRYARVSWTEPANCHCDDTLTHADGCVAIRSACSCLVQDSAASHSRSQPKVCAVVGSFGPMRSFGSLTHTWGRPLGYASQGNEFSYQMLFASNFILNWCARSAHDALPRTSAALTRSLTQGVQAKRV